jgi:hypothetical protein
MQVGTLFFSHTVDKKGCVTQCVGGGVCVSLCVSVSDDVTGVQGVMLGRVILWVWQWNRVPLCTRKVDANTTACRFRSFK